MNGMGRRNVRCAIGVAVAALVLPPAGYGAAGLIGGAIPANPAWREPAAGVRIFVESNGVHTALTVPKVAGGIDWRRLLRPDQLRDPRYAGYGYASFGWGEAHFYRETPTWADVRPATVLRAGLGSDDVLVHVAHVPRPVPGSDVRAVVLTLAEYRRLAGFIDASFAQRPAHDFGYAANDVFYTARGHYDAVHDCNAWTGDALRQAGVRVGAWTPFAGSVLRWFP